MDKRTEWLNSIEKFLSAKPCYFCGADTLRFKEHYTFCPNCAVIYTNYIKHTKECDHVKDGTPNVLHPCWFKKEREAKIHLIRPPKGQQISWDEWRCSKCDASAECDGW